MGGKTLWSETKGGAGAPWPETYNRGNLKSLFKLGTRNADDQKKRGRGVNLAKIKRKLGSTSEQDQKTLFSFHTKGKLSAEGRKLRDRKRRVKLSCPPGSMNVGAQNKDTEKNGSGKK